MWQIFFLCFSFVFFWRGDTEEGRAAVCSSLLFIFSSLVSYLYFPSTTRPVVCSIQRPHLPPNPRARRVGGWGRLTFRSLFLYETPCRLSRNPPTPGTYLNQPFAPSHTHVSPLPFPTLCFRLHFAFQQSNNIQRQRPGSSLHPGHRQANTFIKSNDRSSYHFVIQSRGAPGQPPKQPASLLFLFLLLLLLRPRPPSLFNF